MVSDMLSFQLCVIGIRFCSSWRVKLNPEMKHVESSGLADGAGDVVSFEVCLVKTLFGVVLMLARCLSNIADSKQCQNNP